MKASGWIERHGKMPKGRGLGLACSHFVSGTTTPKHWTGEPHATVNLRLDFDGGITVLTGAADIGQGSNTMAAQMVAEVLGVDWKPLAGDFRRQCADSQGQWQLFLASHLYGRQCRHPCRRTNLRIY